MGAALPGRGLQAIDGGGWRTLPAETDGDADPVGLCVLPVPEGNELCAFRAEA